jgi:hypothetical protein
MTSLIVRLTGDEYRARANESRQRRIDSIDRSGISDGFVTQKSNDLMDQLYSLAADVADNGGHDFPALETLAGVPVDAVLIDGKYGLCWMVDDDDPLCAIGGTKFVTAFPKRESTMAKKGLRETTRFVPADQCAVQHVSSSNARGFSGLSSVRTVVTDATGWADFE